MKKRALLVLLLVTSTASLASPKGFDAPSLPNASPQGFDQNIYLNTIEGVKKNAQDGDFVLLQGFVKLSADGEFFLIDSAQHEIKVIPQNPLTVDEEYLSPKAKWQMWGQIRKSLFDYHLDLISFSCEL